MLFLHKFTVRRIFCFIVQKAKYTHTKLMNKIAVCQTCCGRNKLENLRMAEALVRDAAAEKAKIIFLPECIDFISTDVEYVKNESETLDGSFVTAFKKLAKELNIWISLGGVHIKFGGGVSMCHILIDGSDGSVCSYYKKVHLFRFKNIDESSRITTSNCIVKPVSTPVGNLSLAICFDVRFGGQAELYRRLGTHIIAYPSAFTKTTGEAHWSVLLRARAIETQCYVVAAAQVGKHSGSNLETFGHAMVVDPWGNIISDCGGTDYPSFKIAVIDLERIANIRKALVLHPRYDLYVGGGLQTEFDSSFSFGGHSVVGVFYETLLSVAFVNHKPLLPGHVLIAPKRSGASRMKDLTFLECSDLFNTVKLVGEKLEAYYGCTSLTIAVQDGEDAGQTVKHVHVHLIPRKKCDIEHNDEIYSQLEEHDRSVVPFREEKEMLSEAAALRALFE